VLGEADLDALDDAAFEMGLRLLLEGLTEVD